MSDGRLPVRPNLDQLKHQAKDLLREMKRERANAKLSDAQFALARRYGVVSWPRLALACRLTDAIWRDDVNAVRALVTKHPPLLHEMARGTEKCSWGPPMTYAANLGRDRIIEMLRALGANDFTSALARALLQGKIDTARLLEKLGARPPRGAAVGCAEALNDRGLAYVLDFGGDLSDGDGNPLATVAMTLETYTRRPDGKHRCLELLAAHGVALPDTAAMAIHRGRIDLLEELLRRDPNLLTTTLRYQDIYPLQLGCHADESLGLHGTPLIGATLLHMCVDYDEIDIARWLLDRGMPVDVRADVDSDGFGGHTALFGCVVSYPHLNKRQQDASFARLLLDRGADPNARASLGKRVRFGDDESLHEYRDVTPLAWGERFHARELVSAAAMRSITERGGHT
jgi:Ankyrin repeat